jgi:hypothetical protein
MRSYHPWSFILFLLVLVSVCACDRFYYYTSFEAPLSSPLIKNSEVGFDGDPAEVAGLLEVFDATASRFGLERSDYTKDRSMTSLKEGLSEDKRVRRQFLRCYRHDLFIVCAEQIAFNPLIAAARQYINFEIRQHGTGKSELVGTAKEFWTELQKRLKDSLKRN